MMLEELCLWVDLKNLIERIFNMDFRKEIYDLTLSNKDCFNRDFGELLGYWDNASSFIYDVCLNWFNANWRKCKSTDEACFLLLNNARLDLISAVDSFVSGFLRGPNLLSKSSIEKCCTVVILQENPDLLKNFKEGASSEGKWIKTLKKRDPLSYRLYTFVERHYTHEMFSSFSFPYQIDDLDLDKRRIAPWCSRFSSQRWATAYVIQGAFVAVSRYVDFYLHRGTNCWDFSEEGVKTIDTFIDEDLERVSKKWEKVNKELTSKFGDKGRIYTL